MKSRNHFSLRLAVAAFFLTAGTLNAQQIPPAGFDQAKQIEVLKSDAAFKEKNEACRALALRGTAEAVPALAPLLTDEKLSHIARYALEQINGPAATLALRQALGTAKGLPLVGVISSVGAMRDTAAIPTLAGFLNGGDAAVAEAAAVALGRIGTGASAKVLMTAMAKPTPAVYDGLLRVAETLPRAEAATIYDAVRQSPASQPLRMAALRSAILARGEQGLPLLLETVRGNDYALALAAIHAAREVPGATATKALAAEMESGKLAAERQVLLVQVLGDRRDKAASPQLVALARKSDGALRAATVKSIVQIGDAASLPLLAEMSTAEDAEVSKTARLGLANFSGREAEAPIVGMLQSKNNQARIAAAELVAYRKMTGAMPQLVLAASDADAAVAVASLRALGDIGGNAEALALIKIVSSGTNAQAAEAALATIYSRSGEGAITDAVIAALPAAPTPAKISLLRVLRRVGGPKGLAAVRTAMADTNAEVRENAIRNLTDWPTIEALPELLALAKTPPTPAMKILALRGSLRLVPLQSGTPDQKLASLKEAMTLVERPEEKRLALSALSSIPTAESLALVMQEITNPALKQEASIAAVAIGEELIKTQPDVVLKAMESVMTVTEDKNLRNRAQALLRQKPK